MPSLYLPVNKPEARGDHIVVPSEYFLNSDAYKDLIRGEWDIKGKGNDKKVKNLIKKLTPMLEKSGKLLQILYNEVL